MTRHGLLCHQTLPVVTAHGERVIVLSRMHSPVRRGEVAHLNNWAKKRGFATFSIVDCDFEGAGDAIWNYGTGEIFGGHGFRTDPKAYEILRDQFGLTIHPLKLVDANYYHLDTCFVVLGADTAAYLPKAFDQPSQEILRAQFPRLIEIDEAEARLCFAGNATAIGGHTVVLQKGSTHFQNHLREIGLKVIEVETGEFIKGGGSVFCMKQLLF
ncbi:MAG: dimethylarginine dimethylaminohydrolase family protein [Bdellovibrionales bacterium]